MNGNCWILLFPPTIYGSRASRLGHKSKGKNPVRNLRYRPRTRLVRGIYLRGSHIHLSWSSCRPPNRSTSILNWEMLVCVEGFSSENLEKKTSEQRDNQQQTQSTYGTGPESNPGNIGGGRALSILRHQCPLPPPHANTSTMGGIRKVH